MSQILECLVEVIIQKEEEVDEKNKVIVEKEQEVDEKNKLLEVLQFFSKIVICIVVKRRRVQV